MSATDPVMKRRWRKKTPAQIKRSNALAEEKRHDLNIKARGNEVKCIECGMVFTQEFAFLNGFSRPVNRHQSRVICNEC